MRWTQEAVDTLTFLWLQKWSASQIAAVFCRDGCTRNAVIGKVTRLGLCRTRRSLPLRPISVSAPRPQPFIKPRQLRPSVIIAEAKKRAELPVAELPPEPAPAVAGDHPVTLFDRQGHQCCWPLGRNEDEHRLYCGAIRDLSSSDYCQDHRVIAYGPGTPSERRAVPDLNKRSHITRAHV